MNKNALLPRPSIPSRKRRGRRSTRSHSEHIQAVESRILFAAAQVVPPVGFFSADIQQPGLAPADFVALPTLNDSSAALVKEQLANAHALGQTLAVRVDQPLTTPGAINTFDQFPIQYVFGDFYDANRASETHDLADQVLASRLSSAAVVGNFNLYPNASIDPTRPASLVNSQAPRFMTKPTDADYTNSRSTIGAGNNQSADDALWPGSPDYRNPAQGNSGAPNIRAALFTLPIQRLTLTELGLRNLAGAPSDATGFTQPGRPNATDAINIPNVTRFNGYGNPALGGGPSGTGFVQNAATPSNGQLLSRGDFQAMILHYRLRGALSVNLQENPAEGGSVVGYSATQAQSDVKSGWAAAPVVNEIAGRGDYALANLTNVIGDAAANSADVNPRNTEISGAVWSGVYDRAGSVDPNTGMRRMSILLSNLSAVLRNVDMPDNIDGFSIYGLPDAGDPSDVDNFNIQPGQHRVLNFSLKTSPLAITQWVFDGDTFVGLDNNRNGIGVGGPGQTFTSPGTQQFGTMKISDAPAMLETDAGQNLAAFTVTRSGDTSGAASVQYFAGGITATGGVDFEVTSGELDFAADQVSKTIFIKVNGDTDVEADETFFVRLVSPFNATLEIDQGTGTITNDDLPPPPPALVLNAGPDQTVTEGNSGTKNITFHVSLNQPAASDVTVQFLTKNDTAVSGSDYVSKTGTVTFLAGQTTRSITVQVKGDTTVEPDERFKFIIFNPTGGATLGNSLAFGNIRNDDPAKPKISIAGVSLLEGNSGTRAFQFKVVLDKASSTPVTVKYATSNGTATAGSDYTALALTTLTFAANETTKFITVFVKGDTAKELDETFFLNLSSATNATIAVGKGTGTIRNDD
jgi:hypothetical protein